VDEVFESPAERVREERAVEVREQEGATSLRKQLVGAHRQ
jgi:hypothetical protein